MYCPKCGGNNFEALFGGRCNKSCVYCGKAILCKKLFLFAYTKKDGECHIDQTASKFINLNKQELLKKKNLITMTYGFDKGSFEEISCKDKEAFTST